MRPNCTRLKCVKDRGVFVFDWVVGNLIGSLSPMHASGIGVKKHQNIPLVTLRRGKKDAMSRCPIYVLLIGQQDMTKGHW